MNLGRILLIIGSIIMAGVVLSLIGTYLQAKKNGILSVRFCQPLKYLLPFAVMAVLTGILFANYTYDVWKRNAVIAEARSQGAQVILEYEDINGAFGSSTEEAAYIDQWEVVYKKTNSRDGIRSSIYGLAALCCTGAVLLSFGWITKRGYCSAAMGRCRPLLAEKRGEAIVFYWKHDKRIQNKPAFVYRNTEKNRQRFAHYLPQS